MGVLFAQPSQDGVEFYLVGVLLALVSGIGPFGVVLFEFSRLLAFESAAAADDS